MLKLIAKFRHSARRLFWLWLLLCAPVVAYSAEPQPVALRHVRRVVLDPGHGGTNAGSIGIAGIAEKVLTLDYANAIAAWLRTHSTAEVLLTRQTDTDVGLRDRPRLANQWQADLLISIHANSHELPQASGMEVFFLAADAVAQANRQLVEREEGGGPRDGVGAIPWSVSGIVTDLGAVAAHSRAEVFALQLASALQKIRKDARFRGVKQAPFGVLKEAKMPAVVLEVGYISHPLESKDLLDKKTPALFAQAILAGMVALDTRIDLESK